MSLFLYVLRRAVPKIVPSTISIVLYCKIVICINVYIKVTCMQHAKLLSYCFLGLILVVLRRSVISRRSVYKTDVPARVKTRWFDTTPCLYPIPPISRKKKNKKKTEKKSQLTHLVHNTSIIWHYYTVLSLPLYYSLYLPVRIKTSNLHSTTAVRAWCIVFEFLLYDLYHFFRSVHSFSTSTYDIWGRVWFIVSLVEVNMFWERLMLTVWCIR